MLLMSSSLLLQLCSTCLVCLTWIVFVMGGWWPYSFRFVASKTCSIQLAAFLCNCREAFSPYVWLASMWCIHIVVSIRPLLGKNCISFHRSGLTSIWPIASLIKAHVFCQICVDMETYATSCSFQNMYLGFGFGGCICQRRYIIVTLIWGRITFEIVNLSKEIPCGVVANMIVISK